MAEKRTVPVSRRHLLAMIGTAAGSSAMYQAMTSLGHAAESTTAADQARRRPEGRLGADPRRGACRPSRGARAAPGRLQGGGAGIQRPRRRPLLDFARRRRLYRARRRRADLRFESGPLLQSRTLADSLSPPRHPRLLQAPRRQRSSRSSRSTTTPMCTRRRPSAASRSASATCCRISRAASPNCSPRRSARTSSTSRSSAEDKEVLLEALRQWGALDANYATRPASSAASAAATSKDPGGGLDGEPVPSRAGRV